MLLLFDIDLTLLTTEGAGMAALGDAGRELFGPHFDETRTDYGGRLDPVIITNLLLANNLEPTDDRRAAMRQGYRKHLAPHLAARNSRALPGVHDLIAALAPRPALTLGLLTGNFRETGLMKLHAARIDPSPFELNVWGDESPHPDPQREHLPAVALDRYRAAHAAPLPPHHATIIGDTVHDVSCALANGCRVLAVATGHASHTDLTAAGAHRVVNDLTNTQDILSWLLNP